MLLLFMLLCYSWTREILSGNGVAEARAARIGTTCPWRAAARSAIIHDWSRGRALSQCTLVEGSLAGTALETEIGGLSGNWSFAVGGWAGGVGIVGVVMMRGIAGVAHGSEGKKADMVVSMQGPLCDAGSALASCRVYSLARSGRGAAVADSETSRWTNAGVPRGNPHSTHYRGSLPYLQ